MIGVRSVNPGNESIIKRSRLAVSTNLLQNPDMGGINCVNCINKNKNKK